MNVPQMVLKHLFSDDATKVRYFLKTLRKGRCMETNMLFFCKTKHFSAEEKETLFLMQMYLEKGRFCSLLLHQCCSLPPAPYFRFRLCPGFTSCLEPKIITPKCPSPANPARKGSVSRNMRLQRVQTPHTKGSMAAISVIS